jgi:hypothetical protein
VVDCIDQIYIVRKIDVEGLTESGRSFSETLKDVRTLKTDHELGFHFVDPSEIDSVPVVMDPCQENMQERPCVIAQIRYDQEVADHDQAVRHFVRVERGAISSRCNHRMVDLDVSTPCQHSPGAEQQVKLVSHQDYSEQVSGHKCLTH